MATPQRKKFLFLTNSEHGQANVLFATIYELVLRGFEIHVASFEPLRSRVTEFQLGIERMGLGHHDCQITFHVIPGISMADKWKQKGIKMFHRPGVGGAIGAYSNILEVMAPWSVDEYAETYLFCVNLIESIKPDLNLVDSLFSPALDACSKFPGTYAIFNAISHSNIITLKQPKWDIVFRYSPPFSGIGVPLPWYHILFLTSFWLRIIFALFIVFSRHLRPFEKFRHAQGLRGRYPCFKIYMKKVTYLCPSLPETDLAFPIHPMNVVLCGPLLVPALSSLNSDIQMRTWLQRSPTILINLGTLAKFSVSWIREMATTIRLTTSQHQNIQVLWKLKTSEEGDRVAKEILSAEISSKRVRLEQWLRTEPSELLNSENIICSVHHGGANTYYEATLAGIPQIILPTWFDTYDFAVRVEYLGIGIYGNKTVAPEVDAKELGSAMTTIIRDVQQQGPITQKAKALEVACKRFHGRGVAADKIIELVNDATS